MSSKQISAILFDGNIAVVRLMSLLIFFECLSGVFLAYYRTRERIRLYSILIFLKAYLTVGLVAVFVLLDHEIIAAITGLLLSSLSMTLLMGSIIVYYVGRPRTFSLKVGEYLAFSIPTIPTKISNWLVNSSDRYLIGILLGVAFVGYYSPAYVLGMIIMLFVSPITFVLPVELAKLYDAGEIEKVKSLMYYSNKFFLTLAIPSVFGLSLLSKKILLIITTPTIAYASYDTVPFVATAALLIGSYAIYAQAIVLEKKTKITAVIWLISAVINIGLNLLLIPRLGILAAAVTTFIAFLFAFASASYFSLKFIPFDTAPLFAIKAITASVPMAFLILYWPLNGIVWLLVEIMFSTILYLFSLFLLKGITKKEIMFFMNLLHVN